MTWYEILLLLICGHFVCDYPLQSQYIADNKGKDKWVMIAHCATHAMMVGLITKMWFLGVLEFILHYMLDTTKCRGQSTLNEDQICHIICKLSYIVIIYILLLKDHHV